MKLFKISLLTGLALSGIALPALAGRVAVGTPLYKGTEIDGTPWQWTGSNWTEAQAKKKGADLACKGFGYKYAIDYEVKKGQEKGTWRYNTDGSLEWCDFCQWYITDLDCYKERR